MLARVDSPRGQSTFSIDQVAKALMITPAIITNHQHNNGLDFCSEPPGRGSARLFCTLDVYMLALLREIVALTGDANRAAMDINRLTYSDDDGERMLPPSRRGLRKKRLREDMDVAREVFTHRRPFPAPPFGHAHMDWFLLRGDVRDGFRPFRYVNDVANYRDNEFSNILYHGAIARRGASFFNATMTLSHVDDRLLSMVAKREKADA